MCPCARTLTHTTPHKFPCAWIQIIISLPILRIYRWILDPLNADSSLVPISQHLKTDCRLCATLESSTMSFRNLSRTGFPQCLWTQNSIHGPYEAPESKERELLGAQVSWYQTCWSRFRHPRVLLQSFFPELSLDMVLGFLIDKNGCKKTLRNSWCWTSEKDGSIHHAWNYLVCELVFGQHIWFGCFWVLIDSAQKHQSSRNSHRWSPAFVDHFDHRFIILKNIQLSTHLVWIVR